MDKWKDAEEAFRKASELKPNSEYFRNLGACLGNLGDLEGARICFEKAVIADPDDAIASEMKSGLEKHLG